AQAATRALLAASLLLRSNCGRPCMAFVIGVALPKHTLVYLLRRRFDLLSALWRGTFWHLGRLGHRPAMHGLPQLERSKSDAASKALVAA
ncbi:MAG: hypothetical protein AAFV01_15545, partial [Bacteroidota bacterium]